MEGAGSLLWMGYKGRFGLKHMVGEGRAERD